MIYFEIISLAIAFACAILPAICGTKFGKTKYFSPMHLCATMAFLGVTLKVFVYTFLPDLGYYRRFTGDPHADMMGLVYVILFVSAMCIGYVLAVRNADGGAMASLNHRVRISSSGGPLLISLAVCAFIIVAIARSRGLSFELASIFELNQAKQHSLNSDNVGSTGAIWKNLIVIPRFLLFMAIVRACISPGRTGYAVVCAIMMALVITALATGDRVEFMRIALIVGIALVMCGWRIRFSSLPKILAFGAFILASVGLMSFFRTSDEVREIDLLEGIETVGEQAVSSTYFLDINVPTILVEKLRPDQSLGGASYTWWTFGWIPRQLWPEKPAVDAGTYLKRTVLEYGEDSIGAINITGPGEAFLNFGWWGILVGVPLGALYRVLEVWALNSHVQAPLRAGLYPSAIVPFLLSTLQSSFSAAIISFAMTFGLGLALVWLFTERVNYEAVYSYRKVARGRLSKRNGY